MQNKIKANTDRRQFVLYSKSFSAARMSSLPRYLLKSTLVATCPTAGELLNWVGVIWKLWDRKRVHCPQGPLGGAQFSREKAGPGD